GSSDPTHSGPRRISCELTFTSARRTGTIHRHTRTRAHAMKGRPAVFALFIGGWMAVALSSVYTSAPPPGQRLALSEPQRERVEGPDTKAVLDKYCVTCHSQRLHTAGLVLEGIDVGSPASRAEVWERV